MDVEWDDARYANTDYLQCWMERSGRLSVGDFRLFVCQEQDKSWKVITWIDGERIDAPLHTATDLDSAKAIAEALFKVWTSGREYDKR